MDLGKPNSNDSNLVKNNQVNSNLPDPAQTPAASPAQPATPDNSAAPSGQSATNVSNDDQIPVNTPLPSSDQGSDMGVGKPNIGVELEDQKPAALPTKPLSDIPTNPAPEPPKPSDDSIDVPINKYSQNVAVESPAETVPPEPPKADIPPVAAVPQAGSPTTVPMPQPPIKAVPKNATGVITTIAVIALIFGTAAGFFGFRYLDKLKSSASELGPTPTASTSASTTVAKYSSTKYNFSFEYPKDWFINTTSAQADSIIVASDQASLEGTASGYKVAIDFQSNDGKTLKAWVDSYSTTSGETRTPKEITVSGSTAYQQELTKNGPAIATYIPLADTIMIVTYTAPADTYASGQAYYNQIISSFKVTD